MSQPHTCAMLTLLNIVYFTSITQEAHGTSVNVTKRNKTSTLDGQIIIITKKKKKKKTECMVIAINDDCRFENSDIHVHK